MAPATGRRWLEACLIIVAAVAFGAALTWPLAYGEATGSRPRGMEQVDASSVPPAWLLPLDDAYIFLRYSQQLSRGRPFEWSPGELSTGSSSLLYPLLLLPGHWLADTVAGWSRWARFVGTVGLALLGLAGARWLRQLPLPDPWPLAGGLALVLSGPIGLISIAGMEGAWNAAALVAACTLGVESSRAEKSHPMLAVRQPGWLPLVAALPLIRPENALVAGVASVAILAGWIRGVPRWTAPVVLAPGLLLAALNRALTGLTEPTGAIVKSWLATPFLDLAGLWALCWGGFRDTILPVYGGLEPQVLWPPIGLAGMVTALLALVGFAKNRRQMALALLPAAVVWACLVFAGPLSSHLRWQWMRHHHSGLALAWLLGLAGMALALERWAPRLRRVAFLIPLLLVLAVPFWLAEHTRLAWTLAQRHGAVAGWLSEQSPKQTLLLNDAGWLAVAHDGPAIDSHGLGTPSLAHAHRHGAGATVEALARQPRTPTLAAVNPENFHLPRLLGERLIPERENATVLARVENGLLAGTALRGPGLDFGHLPDEESWQARWLPGLARVRPWSLALAFDDGDGETLHGCRPIVRLLGVPVSDRRTLVKGTSLVASGGSLVVYGGSPSGPAGPPLVTAELPFGSWAQIEVPSADTVWLEAPGGAKLCVESLTVLADGNRSGSVD